MKCNPLLIACCLATSIISYSCNKAAPDQPSDLPRQASKGKKVVNVILGGDIKTNESVLPGGRKAHNYVMARTLRDSTVYAIEVRTPDSKPYAVGLFNTPENIRIELPVDSNFIITAAAFKKGSGFGLWYTEYPDYGQVFDRPFYKLLRNAMSYNATNDAFLANLSLIPVFAEDTVSQVLSFFPELDTYIGTADVHAADTVQQVPLPLKRASFGIRYNAFNFSGGKLIVAYENSMRTQIFTPENIENSLCIYTADAFRRRDDIASGERIIVTIKWERPDGTLMTLGQKEIFPPKRNHMLTVNVTLPTTFNTVNSGLNISFTDTDWSSSETINL